MQAGQLRTASLLGNACACRGRGLDPDAAPRFLMYLQESGRQRQRGGSA